MPARQNSPHPRWFLEATQTNPYDNNIRVGGAYLKHNQQYITYLLHRIGCRRGGE
jgi:hypothetical protein